MANNFPKIKFVFQIKGGLEQFCGGPHFLCIFQCSLTFQCNTQLRTLRHKLCEEIRACTSQTYDLDEQELEDPDKWKSHVEAQLKSKEDAGNT